MFYLLAFLGVIAVTPFASTQSAAAIARYFEGKAVIAKIDLPEKGIDIHADARPAVDPDQHHRRIQAGGATIKSGDAMVIDEVKVKKDVIEFHVSAGRNKARVNLRYKDRVPPSITPGTVMASLAEYIEFPFNDRVKR